MQLNLLSSSSRDQILVEWNRTDRPYSDQNYILKGFEDRAHFSPNAVAIVSTEETFNYSDLNKRANQLADYLGTNRSNPSVLVGVYLERSPELIVAVLAVLKSGRAFLLLDPKLPSSRVFSFASRAGITTLITDRVHNDQININVERRILVDQDAREIEACSPEDTNLAISSKNPAYVIYTSGSTGDPKGVIISRRSLINHAFWMKRLLDVKSDDVFLQSASLGFDVALGEIFDLLLNGASLVLLPGGVEPDFKGLDRAIIEYQVTILNITPSLLQMLVDLQELQKCETLRHVLCGGDVMSHELAKDFLTISNAALHNLYGPTEACIDATHFLCEKTDLPQVIPIGHPIDNVQVYILDEALQPVAVGLTGELYIGGDGLAVGYQNEPGWTAESFLPNPFSANPGARLYRTGDLASYLPDGKIIFIGRADRQVKIRGIRIELGEIEQILSAVPTIKLAVVI